MPRWGETLQIFFRLTRSCDIFVTRLNSSVAKICKKNESKALAWGYLMQEESKKKSNFFYDFFCFFYDLHISVHVIYIYIYIFSRI